MWKELHFALSCKLPLFLSSKLPLFLDAAKTTTNTDGTINIKAFEEEAKQIKALLLAITNAGLIIFSSITFIALIIQAIEYLKTDEPQKRAQIKQFIQGILTMYVMVFALIGVVQMSADTLTNWLMAYIHTDTPTGK